MSFMSLRKRSINSPIEEAIKKLEEFEENFPKKEALINELKALRKQLTTYHEHHHSRAVLYNFNDSRFDLSKYAYAGAVDTAEEAGQYVINMVNLINNNQMNDEDKKAQAIKFYQDFTDATLYQFWTPIVKGLGSVTAFTGFILGTGPGFLIGPVMGLGTYFSMTASGFPLFVGAIASAAIAIAVFTVTCLIGAFTCVAIGAVPTKAITTAITGENFLGTRKERAWKPPVAVDEAAAESSSSSSPVEDQKGCLDLATDAVANIAAIGCQFFSVTPKPSYFARFRPQCLGGAPSENGRELSYFQAI